MESNNMILISSLVINALLILERCFNKIKKSSCMGGNIELSDVKNTDNNKIDNIDINKIFEMIKNNNKKEDINIVVDKV